ncbi:hypothetical protein SJAV_23670 [Sulfurisphaera javensis]|uniref:Uncharacterized protein n=1 Tax=Sulfurisphaera javensis TaxID=2049879 RepID=A0AAT9GV06_9CREN
MKGISSIFSSLIVTIITLSLAVPLFLYFNSLYNFNSGIIGHNFNKLNNAITTQLSVIQMGDTTSKVYLYNYGKTTISINLIILNNKEYNIYITIKPNELISLSKIINSNITITNATLVIEANGNYYYYEL